MIVRWVLFFLLMSTLRAADSWDTPHTGNPIVPGYFADPSLVKHEGKYYLYATIDPWGGRTLGCWESTDFKTWTYRELNWPTKEACTSPSSKEAMVWAPSVIKKADGHFFMYVSVGSEVWVGKADHPLGPWTEANGGKPLIPASFDPKHHMIDAEVFIDEGDGIAYLYWGSGWGWKNGRCYVVKLMPDMVTFDGEPRDVTPENYFEAPFMVKRGAHYFLTYSQGVTIRDTYEVRYAVGTSPLGPFKEAANRPLLTTDHARNVVSPGHHAIFEHEGRSYILYHRQRVPYTPESAYRQICVDEITFRADGLIDKVQPTHIAPPFARRDTQDALYGQASASSEADAQHNAFNVVDDNYATRWAAAPGAKGGWLQLDLGHIQSIYRQELRFEYAWKTYRFLLETSNDGQTWTTLADRRTRGLTGSPLYIDAPARARFLRLTFPPDVPGETLSLWEWAVYGN